MPETLAELLRRRLAEARIDNARLTAAYPHLTARAAEARRQVYEAMYEYALRRITEQERRTILDILHPCCPDLFEPAERLSSPPPTHPGLDDPWGNA
jgi:hypothetical protein